MPTERRDALVVALAVATGGMDAIGFIALGGVFASVMTGNLVLLGVSASHRSASLAAHVGVALAGYIVGVVAGVVVAGQPGRARSTWPARVTGALLIELALIVGVTIGWELVGGHPVGDPQLLMLGMAALAMGIQSAAVRALADPGLSSTYMTATLTNLVSAVAAGHGWAGQRRNIAVIAALWWGYQGRRRPWSWPPSVRSSWRPVWPRRRLGPAGRPTDLPLGPLLRAGSCCK